MWRSIRSASSSSVPATGTDAPPVIGGIGTIEGPIVGTILLFALRELFADLGTLYLLILGVVAIVVVLRAPRGIWGYLRARYDVTLFPTARRVRVMRPQASDQRTSIE